MICNNCGNKNTDVQDSRKVDDGSAVRRRRICNMCGYKFITVERCQLRNLNVVKSSGAKKIFDRNKLTESILRALRKRNIEQDKVDTMVNGIISKIETSGVKDIPTCALGEMVLEALLQVDHVAYIRFISVYKKFESVSDFTKLIDNLS